MESEYSRRIEEICSVAIRMAFIRLPQIKDDWNQSRAFFRVPRFSRSMKKTHFSQIKSCLHLCYFHETLAARPDDPLWKISDFLKLFQRNCQFYYSCSPDLSVDEMMLRFSGRSTMKFSQQQKPNSTYGFKMIALNESKNASTYAAVLDIRLPGRSKDYYIFQLARKVGKFHTIVIDRGYTTLSLVEKLFLKGFYVAGTIKKLKNLPTEILKCKVSSKSERVQVSRLRRERDDEAIDADAEAHAVLNSVVNDMVL
jgi:hypothetical protein